MDMKEISQPAKNLLTKGFDSPLWAMFILGNTTFVNVMILQTSMLAVRAQIFPITDCPNRYFCNLINDLFTS